MSVNKKDLAMPTCKSTSNIFSSSGKTLDLSSVNAPRSPATHKNVIVLKIAVVGEHRSGKSSLIRVFSTLTRKRTASSSSSSASTTLSSSPESNFLTPEPTNKAISPVLRNLAVSPSLGRKGAILANGFAEETIPTVFDVVSSGIFELDGREVKISFLDTSGLDDYDTQRPLAYSGVDGVIICFSVDDGNSLNRVLSKWHPETVHYCPAVPLFLCGTKTDIRSTNPQAVTSSVANEIATRIGAQYFECSAKTSENVVSSLQQMSTSIYTQIATINKAKESLSANRSFHTLLSPRGPPGPSFSSSGSVYSSLSPPASPKPQISFPSANTLLNRKKKSPEEQKTESDSGTEPPQKPAPEPAAEPVPASQPEPEDTHQTTKREFSVEEAFARIFAKGHKLYSTICSHFNFMKDRAANPYITWLSLSFEYPIDKNKKEENDETQKVFKNRRKSVYVANEQWEAMVSDLLIRFGYVDDQEGQGTPTESGNEQPRRENVEKNNIKLKNNQLCSLPAFIIYFYIFCQVERSMDPAHPKNDDEDARAIKYFRLLEQVFDSFFDNQKQQTQETAQNRREKNKVGKEEFWKAIRDIFSGSLSFTRLQFDSLYSHVCDQNQTIDFYRLILFFYYFHRDLGEE